MEILSNVEQFFLSWNFIVWLAITYFNFKDIDEKIPNKFNAMIHLVITAPLFFQLINNSYLNNLLYGYFFAFAILITTIYIIALKYIMPIGREAQQE